MTKPILPIRTLVAEDEPLPRDELVALLGAHPEIEVVAVCRNGLEAARAIADHKPALAFLDIEMPKLTAFEVLELADPAPAVVFVTAYDAYAVRAFEAEAVDYVLKPISEPRLAAAIARAVRRIETAPRPDVAALRAKARPDAPFAERVAIKDGAEITVVPVAEIDYAFAEDDYVRIHAAGRDHLKHETMAHLEASLDPARFVRIHRSCLVNVARIARIEPESRERFTVVLTDGTPLPASRAGERRVRDVLDL